MFVECESLFGVIEHVVDAGDADDHVGVEFEEELAVVVEFNGSERLVLSDCHFDKLNLGRYHVLVLK